MRRFLSLFIALITFFTLGIKTNIANTDSICNADFTYQVYEELGKPSIIEFTNQSTGNPTLYSWAFGDGSISDAKDPIHYFPQNGAFKVRLSIANDNSSDEIIKTIEINVPLEIDFSFKLDSNNIVPNTFVFSSVIDGYYDELIWNFGDQILLNVEDTIHSYPQEDKDYQVTLTAQYNFNDTSVMKKSLAKGLTTFEYFNLGGQVFLGDTLMNNPTSLGDTGIAYLYRIDDDKLTLIDTNRFNKLGYYWFTKKLKAYYIVQVSLSENSTHITDFAPTYVGNTSYWDEAEIINLAQNKFREDVELLKIDHTKSGEQILDGLVKDLIHTDLDEEVFIYLYDTENNLIDFKFSSTYETYEFNQLENGHYILGADVTGVPARPLLIYLSGGKDREFKSVSNSVDPQFFPNPAGNYSLFTFNNETETDFIEIQIFNNSGQLISVQNFNVAFGTNYLHIRLEDIDSGILYLKTSANPNQVYKLIHY